MNASIDNLDYAYNTVQELIQNFRDNEHHYLSPNYSEAEVRQDFIDKFFTALGWDVAHNYQKNPYEQEVKVEKAQKQHDSANKKRADYAFYLAPDFRTVKFFVEAKKPSRTLRQNQNDYFQAAKYGWNANTGISILTDFEELVIIDCRFMPDVDSILKSEIAYYKYTQLEDKDIFAKIYWLLSKEAVSAGNIARYVEDLPTPKGKVRQLSLLGGGYQEIDDSFLTYIDTIRLQLAQAFFVNNPQLSSYELTEATQRTIDRLVFMRFLEDKVIEPTNILNNIANATHSWVKFIAESKRLDTKYNGIVFKPHFIDSSDFLGANENLFKDIATDFDHTNSPYDFNYIPIHVLGSIYERFLGKIIEIENNQATIQIKPEVRKAGGVYYTPKYIVDYIVENTIGTKIKGKSLNAIADITIADIACGSGSFLIGAYDYLLKYYQDYYNKYQTKAKEDGCIFDEDNGIWALSIVQKQKILLNHIYGVDIDPQAIEVTQVSLFLKLLEDETLATANQMQVLFHEKILPDLTNNIKCGNALIDFSIMENASINSDELRKIRPFDYRTAFDKVFKNAKNGFDILIGNPPYVKEYTDREVFEHVKKGQLAKYYQGKMDLWYFFVAYGLDLLADTGKLGYIVPNNWVSNAGASILRNKILSDSKIIKLIDFSGFMVFDEASIQTMIMVLEKSKQPKSYEFFYQHFKQGKLLPSQVQADLADARAYSEVLMPSIDPNKLKDKFLKFNSTDFDKVLDKILQAKNFVLTAKEVAQGIVPNPDVLSKKSFDKFYSDKNYQVGEPVFVIPLNFLKNLNETEKSFLKPLYEPYELARFYFPNQHQKEIIYLTKQNEKENIENLINHLQRFKEVTNLRRETQQGKIKNYHLHWARDSKFFDKGKKIVAVRKCVGSPIFAYTEKPCYVMMSCNIIQTDRINLKYLTGVLNSKLIEFWLRYKGKMQGENFQIDKEPLLQIPIVKPDNQQLENNIIQNVEKLIKAYSQLRQAKTDLDKQIYHNQVTVLENQINQNVYEIYGLSQADIALIES